MQNKTSLQVYEYLKIYINCHQYAPTIREIAGDCYLGLSTVISHLDKLEAWGKIRRERGQARSIVLVEEETLEPSQKL